MQLIQTTKAMELGQHLTKESLSELTATALGKIMTIGEMVSGSQMATFTFQQLANQSNVMCILLSILVEVQAHSKSMMAILSWQQLMN